MPLQRFSGASRFLGASLRSTTRSPDPSRSTTNHGIPVIPGGIKGEKKLIASATGKSYAKTSDITNINRRYEAMRSGQDSFIDTHGNVQEIGKVTKLEMYAARHVGTNIGDIKTRVGAHKAVGGVVRTLRELDIKERQGFNIKSEYEVTKLLEKELTPKPVEIDRRQQALERLHASLRPPSPINPPPVSAPGIRPSAPTTMPLQAVEPVAPPSFRHLGSTFAAPTGGIGITGPQDQPIESTVSLGVPVPTHRDETAVTPITAPVNEGVAFSPALTFQEPKPLDQSLPPHPTVPVETTSPTPPLGPPNSTETRHEND